jgi:hypothetical protein
MNRHHTAALPATPAYDNCLISACLKQLFRSASKAETENGYIISRHVSKVKTELELLNKDGLIELSYDYLHAMEQSLPDSAFYYVVVTKKSTPVLFTFFQLHTLTSHNFSLEKKQGFVKGILRFFLDLKKVKVLVAGNALRTETNCCCFDDKVIGRNEAAEIISSIAEKIAADENVTAVILKDIPLAGQAAKWLGGLGYQAPMPDTVMVMDVDPEWSSLNDYLSALSRKYKTRANKALASLDALAVQQLPEHSLIQYQAQMYRLFKNVTGNQQFVLAMPAKDHFARLKKACRDNFEVTGFFLGQKLVAFYSAFISPDAYELYYVGFDYELNSQYQLYFNILFSGLERAILLRKSQLKLGRTSFDAKASLGARPADVTYFAKTAHIPKLASKWFVNYFTTLEDGKWKLRNPLKQAAA